MQVTAMQITSLRGTNLDLDSRRRDALATYARYAAEDAGMAPQAWVRRTWGFEAYQAKALLRGDASEPMWETILKTKGPHGGWSVALPIMGAVIGCPVHEFFREQTRLAALEAQRAQDHERLAAEAYRRLEGGPADPGSPRKAGADAGGLGAQEAGRLARDVADRSFAPDRRRT
jgi:hypothetical protein